MLCNRPRRFLRRANFELELETSERLTAIVMYTAGGGTATAEKWTSNQTDRRPAFSSLFNSNVLGFKNNSLPEACHGRWNPERHLHFMVFSPSPSAHRWLCFGRISGFIPSPSDVGLCIGLGHATTLLTGSSFHRCSLDWSRCFFLDPGGLRIDNCGAICAILGDHCTVQAGRLHRRDCGQRGPAIL